MELYDLVRETEMTFVRNFALCETDGVVSMYYDPANPTSWDCNHALILDHEKCDEAIERISAFYREKGIEPRIFCSETENELQNLEPYLEKHGFKVVLNLDRTYMRLKNECKINVPRRLEFRRLFEAPPEIFAEVDDDDKYNNEDGMQFVRDQKIIAKCVKNPDFHFVVGYLDGDPVTMCTLDYTSGKIGRVDYVETGTKYRGKGFGRELSRFFVEYHNKLNENEVEPKELYLYSDNPVAIRIYEEAGFENIKNEASWMATAD